MNKKLREHKANMFALLFNDRKEALSLYNAVNGTHYENYEDVEITTLIDEDGNATGISAKMKNDVSFIFENTNSFYEHQSTVNRNMPLRFLLYLAEEIRQIIPGHRLLKRTSIPIPTPVFVVFYNGDEKVPEQGEMKLSDLFEKEMEDPALELTVKIYNINKGHNSDLLNACITLKEYAEFTERAKKVIKTVKDKNKQKAALLKVIDQCISEGILSGFLEKYKEEIVDDYLLFTSEDYEKAALEDLEDMQKELDKKKAELHKKNTELHEKNAELNEKNAELNEKNAELNEKNAELVEKDAELVEKNAELHKKNAELENKKKEIIDLKARLAKYEQV